MAAAGFGCYMMKNRIKWKLKESARSGDAPSLAAIPRSVTRQHQGEPVTQRLPSQSTRVHRSPGSPSVCTIIRVPSDAHQAEWSAATPTCEMRNKIQLAISEMQNALQDELQEDELKIHGVLGQGAFGTVYHGMFTV
jgi:hypothetical protein